MILWEDRVGKVGEAWQGAGRGEGAGGGGGGGGLRHKFSVDVEGIMKRILYSVIFGCRIRLDCS